MAESSTSNSNQPLQSGDAGADEQSPAGDRPADPTGDPPIWAVPPTHPPLDPTSQTNKDIICRLFEQGVDNEEFFKLWWDNNEKPRRIHTADLSESEKWRVFVAAKDHRAYHEEEHIRRGGGFRYLETLSFRRRLLFRDIAYFFIRYDKKPESKRMLPDKDRQQWWDAAFDPAASYAASKDRKPIDPFTICSETYPNPSLEDWRESMQERIRAEVEATPQMEFSSGPWWHFANHGKFLDTAIFAVFDRFQHYGDIVDVEYTLWNVRCGKHEERETEQHIPGTDDIRDPKSLLLDDVSKQRLYPGSRPQDPDLFYRNEGDTAPR